MTLAEFSELPETGYAAGIRDVDLAFARFVLRNSRGLQIPPYLPSLLALCSAQIAFGHLCLELANLYPATDADGQGGQGSIGHGPQYGPVLHAQLPATLDACLAQLRAMPFVGDGTENHPLVLHDTRLYLARYWHAGRRIRQAIEARLAVSEPDKEQIADVRRWLDELFSPPATNGHDVATDWQKLACANVLLHRFSIVTGGPGTGKTTTVLRLLLILQALAQTQHARPLRIRLAAPTGKAAARLGESISQGARALTRDLETHALQQALAHIPQRAVTLHRLLGSRPFSRRFAHHAGNPLALDVLLLDEASMVDIEMMDAVLAALPDHARIVLLGDKDQLASVEAGAVLGELCARAEAGHYTPAHCERLHRISGQAPGQAWQDPAGSPLDQAIVMLRKSYRFSGTSGIGQLVDALQQDNAAAREKLAAIRQQPPQDVCFVTVPPGTAHAWAAAWGAAAFHHGSTTARDVGALVPGRLQKPNASRSLLSAHHKIAPWLRHSGILAPDGYPAIFALLAQAPDTHASTSEWQDWALEVLRQQNRIQVLCALRNGPWGAAGLNLLIEAALHDQGLVPPDAVWYPGQPIMVLRNQPALDLSNGDMGIVLPFPVAEDEPGLTLRVAFAGGAEGRLRLFSPTRLSACETAYAMTVHKSQGSEFAHAVLVMPDTDVPVLTRELIYTAVSRARQSLAIVLPQPITTDNGMADALELAIMRRTRRAGGVWQP